MSLAQRVREFRYSKGWGPDELASRAEISRTALYQIECGKTETPRAGTLKRIARALDISIDALLGSETGGAIDLSSLVDGEDEGEHEVHESESEPDPRSSAPTYELTSRLHPAREADLHRKFHELLASPMGEGIARIVEESYRLLPHSRLRQPV